jgi:hypothetical protein
MAMHVTVLRTIRDNNNPKSHYLSYETRVSVDKTYSRQRNKEMGR